MLAATVIHLMHHRRSSTSKYVAGEDSTAIGNSPYSISPHTGVKRDSGTDDTTGQDAPALRSTGRIGRCAAPRYHLVVVTPLDLGAILTADRP